MNSKEHAMNCWVSDSINVIQVDVGGHPPIPFGLPQLSLLVF